MTIACLPSTASVSASSVGSGFDGGTAEDERVSPVPGRPAPGADHRRPQTLRIAVELQDGYVQRADRREPFGQAVASRQVAVGAFLPLQGGEDAEAMSGHRGEMHARLARPEDGDRQRLPAGLKGRVEHAVDDDGVAAFRFGNAGKAKGVGTGQEVIDLALDGCRPRGDANRGQPDAEARTRARGDRLRCGDRP